MFRVKSIVENQNRPRERLSGTPNQLRNKTTGADEAETKNVNTGPRNPKYRRYHQDSRMMRPTGRASDNKVYGDGGVRAWGSSETLFAALLDRLGPSCDPGATPLLAVYSDVAKPRFRAVAFAGDQSKNSVLRRQVYEKFGLAACRVFGVAAGNWGLEDAVNAH
ncbi:hypothetical protein V502_03176 [Pseudogymnoascus sp. VKM F-4520 (FW-2644)]|nr:hypothetical protein V502_03176 [Pseudogymnoascus sp. VKM F-4520 (FW-2644)]